MMALANWILSATLVSIAISWAMIAGGWLAERARPAITSPTNSLLFNLFYLAPSSLLHAISVPVVAGVVVSTTNALGGGLFRLPSSGWSLVPAIALYALTMDFG